MKHSVMLMLGTIGVMLALDIGSLAQTPTCSNASVQGTYAFECTGKVGFDETPIGAAELGMVGLLTFDGNGGLLAKISQVTFAGPSGVGSDSGLAVTGSYAVNPDCTAIAALPPEGAGLSLLTFQQLVFFNNGFFSQQSVVSSGGSQLSCTGHPVLESGK
jgi:hypothetical protein